MFLYGAVLTPESKYLMMKMKQISKLSLFELHTLFLPNIERASYESLRKLTAYNKFKCFIFESVVLLSVLRPFGNSRENTDI